ATGRYLDLVLPRVPPGLTTRRVYLTVPSSDPTFKLRAAVTPPWADGDVFRACLANGGISNPTCMGAQLTAVNAYLAGSPSIQALSGIGAWAQTARHCLGANGSLAAARAKADRRLDAMPSPGRRRPPARARC